MFEEHHSPDRSGFARYAWNWEINDAVAVVTGASSGIGAEVARALAHAGAKVVLVGRDSSRLDEVEAELTAVGAETLTVVSDLTKESAPAEVVEAASEKFGRIDILVHAAGIFLVGDFPETDLTTLDEQLAVHVSAPYALSAAAVPHMPPGSSIVFVGSNLANIGLAGTASYSASKGAVDALTRTLAVDLAPRRIRVNTLAPGIVRTPMTAILDQNEELRETHISRTLVGRLGTVEDIAAAVLFFSSPASGFVSGSVLTIDGGASIRW
jgi:NAD(P)-dependent dehydrogenase (short-subunit alcohol dehydrogenase family)